MRLLVLGVGLLCTLSPQNCQAQTVVPTEAGRTLFLQKCAFCHGRGAQGGETGPDLTRSDTVKTDVNGNKIGYVIRNGRPEKGMPRFALSDEDISALVAFIHARTKFAESHPGARKGVDPSDLQTGNIEAGKTYFNGAGGCANCHSATGDLAHVARRYQPLRLEMRMLYPEDTKRAAKIQLPSGEIVRGELQYRDEFTVALRDNSGNYRAWPLANVKATVEEPAAAHEALLAKYSDDDIHNLMAYLQTLK
jgi:cytochrome c oxidase cbb3-type subunit III